MELLGTCKGLGMGVPDMRRGIPEELVIHADRNESVGILLERAAHAANTFFKKPPLLILVCMNTRGRPSQPTCPHLKLSRHCGWQTLRRSSSGLRKLSIDLQ